MSPDFRRVHFETSAKAKKISSLSVCEITKLQTRKDLEIAGQHIGTAKVLEKGDMTKEHAVCSEVDEKKQFVAHSPIEIDREFKTEREKNPSEPFDHELDDEESLNEKPNHSYISLIANAILASTEKRLVLSEIYSYVLGNFTYFRDKGPGWRNSIRHNLSLNECFVKAGRSPNGKGHYWAINPANYDDFSKGDFRRRRAQRRARRAMAFQDLPEQCLPFWYHPYFSRANYFSTSYSRPFSAPLFPTSPTSPPLSPFQPTSTTCYEKRRCSYPTEVTKHKEQVKVKKRAFDVESLLKEDKKTDDKPQQVIFTSRLPSQTLGNLPDYCPTKRRCLIQPVRHSTVLPTTGLTSFEHYRNLYHSALSASDKYRRCPPNEKLRVPFCT